MNAPSPEPADRRRRRLPRPLHLLLSAIRHRVSGLPARVGALLGVAFALVFGGAWAFAELSDEILEGETRRVDQAILSWLARHASLIARLQGGRTLRWLTYVLAALLIGITGLSRMYLGVHYPSDVAGGYALGVAWAAACALAVEGLSYFRMGASRWIPEESAPPPGPPD